MYNRECANVRDVGGVIERGFVDCVAVLCVNECACACVREGFFLKAGGGAAGIHPRGVGGNDLKKKPGACVCVCVGVGESFSLRVIG